jgi:hypothetical protein
VLQQGTFGADFNKDTSTRQGGPAALCKIKYFCAWNAGTSTCYPNLNAEYPLAANTGRVNKATVIYC